METQYQFSKISFLLITILLLYPVNIHSACSNNTGSETAKSCSQADVQTAVAACLNGGGGTVKIPAGTCTWTGDVNAQATGGKTLRIIGAGKTNTTITRFRLNIGGNPYQSDIIELSHMTLNGNSGALSSTTSSRLRPTTLGKELYWHDLSISGYDARGSGNISLEGWYGVISNVTIDCTGGDHATSGFPYGILVHGDGVYNVDTSTLGSRNALFIEDSTITKCGHPVVGMCNSHIVLRHSTIDQQEHAIDVHEPGYNTCRWVSFVEYGDGGGAFELYNNIIKNPNLGYQSDTAFKPRAGWGIVANNTCNGFSTQKYCLGMKLGDNSNYYANGSTGSCSTSNTCNRCYDWTSTDALPNRGCSGCVQSPEKYYFFENICYGCQVAATVSASPVPSVFYEDGFGSGCMRENIDYFNRAPTNELSGFSWAPYKYPHPLVKGDSIYPNAPQNFRIQ